MNTLPPASPGSLVELYVLYGFAFLVLAIAVFLQPRRDRSLPLSADIRVLGLFGLLHGIREWWEAWIVLNGPLPVAAGWTSAALLLASYLCLFEFGRRLVLSPNPARVGARGSWVYLPLMAGGLGLAGVAEQPLAGLAAGSRICFGFTGALAAGAALWSHSGTGQWAVNHLAGKGLQVAAIALMGYSLSAGLVVPADPGFPAWLPTKESFHQALGLPVELPRMVFAAVLAGALVLVTAEANTWSRRQEEAAKAETARLNAHLSRRVREDTVSLETINRELRSEIEERRKAESELREKEKLLDTVANSSPAMIRMCGLDRHCTFANQAWLAFTGLAAEQALGEGWLSAVHPDDSAGYLATRDALFETRAPFECEYRLRRFDGQHRWVLEQGKPRYAASGEFAGSLGSCLDITDRKQNEVRLQAAIEQLRDSEQRQREAFALAQREQGRMRALLSAMGTGILFEDRDRRVEYVNPAFLRMWAIGEDFDPVGRPIGEAITHSGRRPTDPAHSLESVLLTPYPHEISERRELNFDDGRILAQSSYPVTDTDGHVIGRMWLHEDITHERQTAEQLLYLAERDPLTGLYNRHRFREHLERGIAASLRSGARFALVYFDLDGFKSVNDSFGHKAGDTVLVRIAGEIGNLIRGSEMFARLGGDEFAILTSLSPGDDPKALPTRIINAIAAIPFRFQGNNVRMTGSVGVALFPEHGEDAEDLVAHADAAMYQAKAQGKNTWAIYDPSKEEASAAMPRLAWNRRVAEVLEQDSFELHFQGVYELASGGLNHLEVLTRMLDPADPGTLIAPGRFIPAAEKSGQIVEIDRRIFTHAVELLATHPSLPPLAVNFSGHSFNDPFLSQFIRSRLSECGVDPKRLIIELAENAAITDIQDAQRFIEAVRGAGCRVCLKDFGSGFATFSYLKYLGAEILKIGGRYFADLSENPDHQVLVKAMVDVARGLDKTIAATCVEDAPTLALIRKLGVQLAQGYHLDRPSKDHPALPTNRSSLAG